MWLRLQTNFPNEDDEDEKKKQKKKQQQQHETVSEVEATESNSHTVILVISSY